METMQQWRRRLLVEVEKSGFKPNKKGAFYYLNDSTDLINQKNGLFVSNFMAINRDNFCKKSWQSLYNLIYF